MDQKVKLQITCDMEDVPSVCSAVLNEVEALSVRVKFAVINTRDKLFGTKVDQVEKVTHSLEELEKVRGMLVKIDNRIADVSSILIGLKQFTEQTQEKKEENKNNQQQFAGM